MLGEFEYLLLTAAMRLGDEAYGAAIRQEIEVTTGRVCSIGGLYTTLDRLEKKGLLKIGWEMRLLSAVDGLSACAHHGRRRPGCKRVLRSGSEREPRCGVGPKRACEMRRWVRSFCWSAVDFAALALEPAERTAVRGDLAESGATWGQALAGIAGLAIRRQAGLWRTGIRGWHCSGWLPSPAII